MAKDVPISQWPTLSVKLHPETLAFLRARGGKPGRSVETEATGVVVEAAELTEIPPVPTATRFQCSEESWSRRASARTATRGFGITPGCGPSAMSRSRVTGS